MNRDRIIAAAEQVVASDGAGASLEEIARQAGVGSATLHRHFSSRQALLQELFHQRVEALCAYADELALSAEPASDLVKWLREVGKYAASTRGFAELMLPTPGSDEVVAESSCFEMIASSGAVLLQHAQDAREVRSDVTIGDLMTWIYTISVANERDPDLASTVDRLLLLLITGIGVADEKVAE
jgi:AcrR family transcriptional regulator